jgi:hypothetical protein
MTRTVRIPKAGATSMMEEGWGIYKVRSAEYGNWQDKQFLDIYFEGMPESLNLRVYEARDQQGNEFAIGNIFRYANAGIDTVLTSDSGDKIVKINDNPKLLIGKSLGCFLYKDGKYMRIHNRVVPSEPFENAAESIDADTISWLMTQAEKSYNEYVKPRLGSEKSGKSTLKSDW